MGFSDELLKDSSLSEEMMLEQFERMIAYYQEMDMEAAMAPSSENLLLPTLLVELPDDDEGRPRFMNHSFLPLDTEDAEFSQFLQFYVELPDPIDGIDELTLLRTLNRINQIMPAGHCAMVEARPEFGLPQMVYVRHILGYPLGDYVDQGVFCETLFLVEMSCTLTSTVISGVASGLTIEEAMAKLSEPD
ncbi:MAG: hypothetical protein Q4B48_01465 [Syntrophomonadaceae bacterium]|nr:hypothetical protein [Syntrophomonadaceae bacterium]